VIIVVCLNPALDITHHVAAAVWGGVNRPAAVHDRPGGKGLNVARTLAALGADVLVTGLAGGITGAGVTAALAALGVTAAFAPVSGETRRTFTVVDASAAGRGVTSFHEAGPIVSAAELAGFRDRYEQALAGAEAVVMSGSLPLGLPPGTYAELIEAAAAAGVPAVLDAHGPALRRGAAAGAAIVKPNLPELEALTGRPLTNAAGTDLVAVAGAAGELRGTGAGAVVATLGPAGMLAVTADGCWRARPGAAVAGNATGAGDAVAAALAHGLVLGRPWDERLRHAVALGAATAAAPVAGEFRSGDYLGALDAVTVDAITIEEAR
jgi:1-phosphofructokinase family hexose kinase